VVQLHRKQDDFTAKAADLHVIGNGTPSFIAGFREQTLFDGPIYTDPSLASYKAAELKRSVVRTLDPRGWLKGVKSFAEGHRQGRTQGDAWQQGGVLVVSPSGDVLWQHASDLPGDNATAQQILAALR
jgi:hypothetical protein